MLQDHRTLVKNGKAILAAAGLVLTLSLSSASEPDGIALYYMGVVTFVALSTIGIFFVKYGKDLVEVVDAFNRKTSLNSFECAAC